VAKSQRHDDPRYRSTREEGAEKGSDGGELNTESLRNAPESTPFGSA